MFLTFTENGWAWLNFLIDEVLSFAATHVLALEEVKVITSEEVKFVLHLPDLRLFNLGFGDWQRI